MCERKTDFNIDLPSLVLPAWHFPNKTKVCTVHVKSYRCVTVRCTGSLGDAKIYTLYKSFSLAAECSLVVYKAE